MPIQECELIAGQALLPLRIKDWKACDFCGRSGEVSEHYIEFRGVSKAFDDHLVLDDVSFFVDRGETCVIMGRSGVGKSVTLKHIMGFLKPDEGRVIVAGEDITDWSEDQLAEIRRKVTMVFQSGALFDSLTVAENIAFPLENRPDLDPDQIEARVRELERSEEHTSELQSQSNLVCRLLLEKKKKKSHIVPGSKVPASDARFRRRRDSRGDGVQERCRITQRTQRQTVVVGAHRRRAHHVLDD